MVAVSLPDGLVGLAGRILPAILVVCVEIRMFGDFRIVPLDFPEWIPHDDHPFFYLFLLSTMSVTKI
jgi:hypothetical protein